MLGISPVDLERDVGIVLVLHETLSKQRKINLFYVKLGKIKRLLVLFEGDDGLEKIDRSGWEIQRDINGI